MDRVSEQNIFSRAWNELTKTRGTSLLNTKDQVFILERLALLAESISIAEAANHLASFSKGRRKVALENLSRALQNGKSVGQGLSGAIDRYSSECLSFAEAEGDVVSALQEIANAKKEETDTGKKILLSLMYPILIAVAATYITVSRWPDIEKFIVRMEIKISGLGFDFIYVNALSEFFYSYFTYFTIGLVCAIAYITVTLIYDTSIMRSKVDNFFVFRIYRLYLTHKLMSPFSLLTRFGVSDAEAIALIRQSTKPSYFKYHLTSITSGIQSGRPLASAMDTGLLDAESVSLLKATSDTSERDKGIKTVSKDALSRYLEGLRLYASSTKVLFFVYAAITAACLVSVFSSLDQVFQSVT